MRASLVLLSATSEDELLGAAAAAERRSEHPLAQLVVAEARRRGLETEEVIDFRAFPGAGVGAAWIVQQRPDLVRGAEFLLNEGGDIRANARGDIEYYGIALGWPMRKVIEQITSARSSAAPALPPSPRASVNAT